MSETTIVNRTQPSFGQQLEAERLEAQTAREEFATARKIADVSIKTGNVELATLAVDALEHAVKTQETGPEELPEDSIGNKAEPPDTPYSPEAELISELLKERAGSNLVSFRKQVIAAFKHLGLDTNQFFGV